MMKLTDKRAAIILVRKTIPVTPEVIAKAVDLGMIPKKDLVDGAYYKGSCRNAWIAMWDGRLNKFIHLRTKFGDTFSESINHPEDDDGYDVFVPVERVENDIDD